MMTAAQKLEALTNLGVELNRVADLDLLMERILNEARRFVNADAGSIYIRTENRLDFSYTQNATMQRKLPPGDKLIYSIFSVPVDENSIAGFVAHTSRALNIPDVYEMDPTRTYHFSRKFDEASGYRTRSMLTIPMKTNRNNVIGVLQIINAQDEAGRIIPFSEDDEKIMNHFASTATVALERARMTRAMILRTIKMAEMRDHQGDRRPCQPGRGVFGRTLRTVRPAGKGCLRKPSIMSVTCCAWRPCFMTWAKWPFRTPSSKNRAALPPRNTKS